MPTQLVNLPEQINGFANGYIDGLNINYVTSGSISVSPGTAFVPSLNRYLNVTGTITQNIPIVSTSTSGSWMNVYAFENSGGVVNIQVTGTAPSNPYSGVARTKTGDNSMRYLGSIFCDNAGYAYRFDSNVWGNTFRFNWRESNNLFPFQFINISGSSGNPVTTSAAQHLIPPNGVASDLYLGIVVQLVANGDATVAVGNSIPSTALVSSPATASEILNRLTSPIAANLLLPPVAMKISGTTMDYVFTNTAGANAMFLRMKGVYISR